MKRLIKKADKFSKVYHVNGNDFRYNYDTNMIELLYEGEVIDETGCLLEDWEDNPEFMCEEYSRDLDAEFENFYQFELKDIMEENGEKLGL